MFVFKPFKGADEAEDQNSYWERFKDAKGFGAEVGRMLSKMYQETEGQLVAGS